MRPSNKWDIDIDAGDQKQLAEQPEHSLAGNALKAPGPGDPLGDLDEADLENPATPPLPTFEVDVTLKDEEAVLKKYKGSLTGALVYNGMPKEASLDSAASQLITDLQQRLKKELNIISSLEKVGTNGSTIKLSMTISGYQMYQELPKEIAADEVLKKSMSSLSEELAAVNVNVEEVYGELLTKWKDFLEARWMKLIPSIFDKVLSKEQVAANVSVVTAPAESEVVKKNATINSTVFSLPRVEVFLRVELEKRLPLAKAINPNIDPQEVEAMNQTLYLTLVEPRIQEEVARAVRDALGDAFSFTITPEGDADFGRLSKHSFWLPIHISNFDEVKGMEKVNATMAGSARKLLSTIDLLKKRGAAGLENVTATVKASLRAHSLDKLLGGFITRIGDLLGAQVQAVKGSSYKYLQGMAPYGICCRSERSSKDGTVKTDEVFWVEAEVTKGGKDTHNGLCPDIREATNPPCVVSTNQTEPEQAVLHHRPYTECYNLAELKDFAKAFIAANGIPISRTRRWFFQLSDIQVGLPEIWHFFVDWMKVNAPDHLFAFALRA